VVFFGGAGGSVEGRVVQEGQRLLRVVRVEFGAVAQSSPGVVQEGGVGVEVDQLGAL